MEQAVQNTIDPLTGKKFLTIGETQAYLGCSRRFIYGLIEKGLPKYKVGARSYIKTEELNNIFQRHN